MILWLICASADYKSWKDIQKKDELVIVYASDRSDLRDGFNVPYEILSKDNLINYASVIQNTKQEEGVYRADLLFPDMPANRDWPITYTIYLPPQDTEIKASLFYIYGGGKNQPYSDGQNNMPLHRILAHNGIAVIQAHLTDEVRPFRYAANTPYGKRGELKRQATFSKEELDLLNYEIAYLASNLDAIINSVTDQKIRDRLNELKDKHKILSGFSFGGFLSLDFMTKLLEFYKINGIPYSEIFSGAIIHAAPIAHFVSKSAYEKLASERPISFEEALKNFAFLTPEHSPILQLENLQKPLLFMHGKKDYTISIQHMVESIKKLQKIGKGDKVTLLPVDMGHDYPSGEMTTSSGLTQLDEYAQIMIGFIDSIIKGYHNITEQQRNFREAIKSWRLFKAENVPFKQEFLDAILRDDVVQILEKHFFSKYQEFKKNPSGDLQKILDIVSADPQKREHSWENYYKEFLFTELVVSQLMSLNHYRINENVVRNTIALLPEQYLEKAITIYSKIFPVSYDMHNVELLPHLVRKIDSESAMFILRVLHRELNRPIYLNSGAFVYGAKRAGIWPRLMRALEYEQILLDKQEILDRIESITPEMFDEWIDVIKAGRDLSAPSEEDLEKIEDFESIISEYIPLTAISREDEEKIRKATGILTEERLEAIFQKVKNELPEKILEPLMEEESSGETTERELSPEELEKASEEFIEANLIRWSAYIYQDTKKEIAKAQFLEAFNMDEKKEKVFIALINSGISKLKPLLKLENPGKIIEKLLSQTQISPGEAQTFYKEALELLSDPAAVNYTLPDGEWEWIRNFYREITDPKHIPFVENVELIKKHLWAEFIASIDFEKILQDSFKKDQIKRNLKIDEATLGRWINEIRKWNDLQISQQLIDAHKPRYNDKASNIFIAKEIEVMFYKNLIFWGGKSSQDQLQFLQNHKDKLLTERGVIPEEALDAAWEQIKANVQKKIEVQKNHALNVFRAAVHAKMSHPAPH